MKASVRRNLIARFAPALPPALIKRAMDEAGQVAAATGYPELVFPLLAEEQVQRISTLVLDTSIHRTEPRFASAA